MNRLAPNAVLPAFAAGRIPVRQEFLAENDGRPYGCCGLSAAVFARHPDSDLPRELNNKSDWAAATAVAADLGLDPSYCRGFMRGWDGMTAAVQYDDPPDPGAYRLGCDDGLDAWAAARTQYLED